MSKLELSPGNVFLRRALPCAAALVVLATRPCPLAGALPGPGSAVIEQARIEPQLGAQLPLELVLYDSTGTAVRLEHVFRGRPVILHLVYYECPMLCKLAGDGLLNALQDLDLDVGDEFDVITLSFDPTEGVELAARAKEMALAQYDRKSAEQGWHFLTGNAASIQRLTDAVGFYAVRDDTTGQYAHAAGVFVLTPGGTASRYLSGIDFKPRDVRLALIQASDGEIASISDQLLMLCYQYDPTTGRYGLAIISALRAGGILTVAVLASAIFVMIRRERRRAASENALDHFPST